MKIASAELQLASSHSSMQHHEVSESLRVWTGPRRVESNGAAPSRPQVEISEAGKSALKEELEAEREDDPRLLLLRLLLEKLTGQSLRILDAEDLSADAPAPQIASPAAAETRRPAAGFGIAYDYRESYSETETTRFSANGVVKTADGKEIRFAVELEMSRAYHEESSVSLRLGDAARQVDPLVLNFSGNAAALLDQRFAFDLDSDGSTENIARLASGSAYLVFDRNEDGRINDGSEMFGPRSGDGFAELAKLDDDGNQWIDEGDAAWEQLQLWQPDENGAGALQSLSAAGVGAISLSRVNTPFELRSTANESFGKIRTSGIFLHANGGAGTIQQVDLAV